MLQSCWWGHFYSPRLFRVFEDFRAHLNMLWWSGEGTWTSRLNTEEQIWGRCANMSKEAPWISKVCSVIPEMHMQCVRGRFAAVCCSDSTDQTAKWPADSHVMWITVFCLIIYRSALSGCVSWLPVARRLHHTSFSWCTFPFLWQPAAA